MLQHSLRVESPDEKWFTYIVDFVIQAGKDYLSPMIDFFDGTPVCQRIGIYPYAELVKEMLEMPFQD